MRGQRCKGFRDLSPEEMAKYRRIDQAFSQSCRGWGYREIKTPTLEYLHLFTATGTLTPSMLNKVYSFLDWDGWSGQRVVLKPDGTIPVARFYIDNLAGKGLARLFYTTRIFGFEDTGKEARERWQGGVELIGVSSPLADIELMVMSLELLKSLGINNFELRLSHAGLIKSLLSEMKLSPEEQARVFDQILDGDTEVLARIKSEKPRLSKALKALLELKGESSGILKNVKALFNHSLPELEAPIDNLISVVEQLEAMGYRYKIDITSGKGFEYYTGLIFQLFVGDTKIGGGGRYDDLIPLMGGGDVPASGFALYFDYLVDLLDKAALPQAPSRGVLIKAGPGAVKTGFDIAARIRDKGYIAELEHGEQSPSGFRWQLEINDKKPGFVLTDKVKHQTLELDSADKVLMRLGEVDDNQDSTA